MSDETGGDNIDLTDFSQEQVAAAPPPEAPVENADETDVAGNDVDTPEARNDDTSHHTAAELEAVFDVPVDIAAILGRTYMEVSDLLKLEEGDVVELDRKVGEAIDIFVNNRLVARGEVVLVEERLGVTMTEIIKSERH